MIVLLDADALIDLALDRSPHALPAGELLDRLERRPGSAFVAWHSISNFYYLVASRRGAASTRAFIQDLMRFVEVAPTTTDDLLFATKLNMRDFQDAMQVAAAAACRADVIATRNVRNYRNSPIRAATPKSLAR